MREVKYCWLTDKLDFSTSWGQKDHDSFFTERIEKIANEKGWRLIKYEVLTGNDFEFPYGAKLTGKNATE